MKHRSLKITIFALAALIALCGCGPKGQVVYPIGAEYNDRKVSATVLSAAYTDQVDIDGENPIIAPDDEVYMTVEMEITVKNNSGAGLLDFVVDSLGENIVCFDKDLTDQANGYDILDMQRDVKHTVLLVFVLDSNLVTESVSDYNLTIRYTDGGCSDLFPLWPMMDIN